MIRDQNRDSNVGNPTDGRGIAARATASEWLTARGISCPDRWAWWTERRPRRGPKLWQGLLTLPLGRPKVSNPKPGGRPTVQQTAGSGDPAPNRQRRQEKTARSWIPT